MTIAPCGTAMADDYEWTGATTDPVKRDWHDEENWVNNSTGGEPDGYPGEGGSTDDTVDIPHVDNNNYPSINGTEGLTISFTIRSLILRTDPEGPADLLLSARDQGRSLTITERDGLTLEDDTTLRIAYNASLNLNGGGTIVLDGRIEAVADLAYVFFAGPHTYVTTGDGIFLGTTPCTPLNLCQSGPSTLVLGPDNGIHGSAFVTIALVNKGLVDPNDPDGGIGDTITLTCEPKIGDGDWQVTCDACDEDSEKNTMIVKTVVVGTGDLVVGHHGLLQVKRMFSLHGDFTMSGEKAKIEVDKNVVFDVDRFTSQSCPQ